MYFRLLVVTMAFMWGRCNVATLYRDLDAKHHRTRFNNFLLVKRWDPEAALHQTAQAWLRTRRPGKGETVSWLIDDSKTAKRGQAMDAIATRQDPTTEAYLRGHQDVCAIVVCRGHVLPCGLRLSVNKAHCATVGLPFRKRTELAAPRIREFRPPVGVKVVVLFDTYSLCPTVVKACRQPQCQVASLLKRHRSLFKHGWQLKAGRDGRHLFHRRRTETLDLAKPSGPVRDRFVDAGWLEVSTLGPRPGGCSRTGTTHKILGLVAADVQRSAADLLRTDDKRGTSAQGVKETTQLLGLGQYQNRSLGAAVTHRHLVCLASALLPHLRIERDGAQGQRTPKSAADVSTATAQDQLRARLWEDLITSFKERPQGQPVLDELERLCVA